MHYTKFNIKVENWKSWDSLWSNKLAWFLFAYVRKQEDFGLGRKDSLFFTVLVAAKDNTVCQVLSQGNVIKSACFHLHIVEVSQGRITDNGRHQSLHRRLLANSPILLFRETLSFLFLWNVNTYAPMWGMLLLFWNLWKICLQRDILLLVFWSTTNGVFLFLLLLGFSFVLFLGVFFVFGEMCLIFLIVCFCKYLWKHSLE